ncbi:MAG: zinc ribbon domain-containing protein, partial [Promethearchaeota archaeon]
GEIISDGFYLFGKNLKELWGIFILFFVISIFLKVFLLTDLNWHVSSLAISANEIMEKLYSDPLNITDADYNIIMQSLFWSLAIGVLENMIGAVCTTIAMCSVGNYLYKRYLKEETSFILEFKKAFNPKLMLVVLVLSLGIPIGFALLFIPGIIIFGFFIFLVFTYNLPEIERPVKEARLIAKKSFLKIIGIFLICALIAAIIEGIYVFILSYTIYIDPITFSSWFNPASRNYLSIFLYYLVYDIVGILIAPLFICLLTPLFASLKAKKELGLQYQRGYYPAREPYRQSYPQSRPESYKVPEQEFYSPAPISESGMYCPYCGHHVRTPKKFCPNCGESLDSLND